MSSTLQPPAPTAPLGRPVDRLLRQRLAALRRRLRVVVTVRGVAWIVACAGAALILTGLLDYRIHLPGLVRAFVLTGTLAGAGVLLYRYLLKPLAQPTDDLSLALRIEERYPLLNDSLASTVQFLQRTPPHGESASMRGEAIRRALARIEGVDFNRVVDARGLRTVFVAAVLVALAGAGLAVRWPALTATAVARVANPFAAIDWPKKTRLHLDKVVERIGRNREYRLQGSVAGVIPKEVTVEVSHDGFPSQQKSFAVHPEEHTFTLHLKPEEVQRNFRFSVFANDAVAGPFSVAVLPLPVLVAIDGKPSPQVRLAPPAYTDLPSPQNLPPGQGNLDVVAGTVVSLRAAADRPLRRAWIEYQPELAGTIQGACLAPLASPDALGVLGSIVLSKEFYQRIPATIHADPTHFSVTFRPSTNGYYGLHFEDEHELVNSRTYELRLRLDPAPVVKLERPSPARDVLQVLPTAELPLLVRVEDTQFAVRSAWLEYRTQTAERWRVVPLYDYADGLRREALPWAGVAALGAPAPRLRPKRLEFERRLAIRSLRHADGSGIKEGDTVTLQAFADDFDDVSVGKEPGKSHQVTIQVVGRDKLDVELNQEQGRIQKEIENLRNKQREALTKVKEVESRLRKGGKMLPERDAAEAEAQAQKARDDAAAEDEKADKAQTEAERQQHRKQAEAQRRQAEKLDQKAQELKRQAPQLTEAEQIQQQIRERVGNDNEGLRAEVERLRETLRQNHLERTNAMERMKRVAQELDRLAEKELEHIEPRLTNARKLAELEDPKTREERRVELEKRAKEAEQEAKAAEERARKLNEQAAALEQGDEAAHRQAERHRRQAQEESQKANERRSQAERDRRDAAEMADPEKARRTLADARRGQEEVERSLSKLLQELEPWSSTLEISGEAGRILEEQKELQGQLDDLAKKDFTGKSRDTLTENEKAELDQAKEAQKRLQERTANLLEQMKKLAESRAQTDPDTAGDLKKAAEQAEANNLGDMMKSAQDSIGENKLNEARNKQREAIAELEKLNKSLKDGREARLDRLARKLREAEQMVERLMDEQEKLQRKIREAAAEKDPKKRDEELKRLARRQKELQQQADEAIKKLSRLGNDRAREMMQEAREDMADALKELSRGRKDEEKQDDILDRMEEARRELERARQKAEEELAREQLVRVADVLRRIRERQEGHLEESKRIQDSVLQEKKWSRGLQSSFVSLGDNQRGLSQETAGVAKKDLTSAPVFARLLERSAKAMARASDRIAALRQQTPPLEALPDAELKSEQARALRCLDQLLASLKDADDDPRPLSRGGDEGGGDGGGGGGPQGDDSLPPLAQLKLLRALQKEVNDRTEDFRKKHPNADNLGPKEKAELQEILQEQKEVADLLKRYIRPAGDEPDAEMKLPEKADNAGEKKQ